jgi:hypothetical protein
LCRRYCRRRRRFIRFLRQVRENRGKIRLRLMTHTPLSVHRNSARDRNVFLVETLNVAKKFMLSDIKHEKKGGKKGNREERCRQRGKQCDNYGVNWNGGGSTTVSSGIVAVWTSRP